ncbi:DUF4434 family protein [Pseudomonas piscis]|uniref:DUF4434 family protein n=1 Tax=Pseudomonas piscis TaxID=2614538 RepID=A0ABY9NC61_9PSED|nr:DUF4434 family protein [Pseudomonas piscis]WMN15468.1 DUF4434 family protein [Pseudomonas piscis]
MKRLMYITLLWLGLGLHAQAEERLFYQPLNSDAALGREQWRKIWQDSARNGVKTLIVQWTAYGDSHFGDAHGWLADSLRQAREQGLQLVLGLYMDPAYYQRIQQLDSAGLETYWQAQLGTSLARQRKLLEDWQLPVSGWYLPMELDDLHFLDAQRRITLQRQLKDFARQLDAPLHLSAFSAGHLAPQVNGAWLGELASAGLQVWWQDGAGTARLAPMVRDSYAGALPCGVGIVREAFRQTSGEGQPFRAEPATPDARPAGCHASAVFSLRYRPWGQALRTP